MAMQNNFYSSAFQNPWHCVSLQKATLMANSPSSCQMFSKETPRSLEQQLQENRSYCLLRFPLMSNPLSLKQVLLDCFKGLVHPKMKISPWFTHPQGILGVYDFLLSDKSIRSYIKNVLVLPSFIMAVGVFFFFQQSKRSQIKRHNKCASHGSGGWIKASCSELMHFGKKKYPCLKCYKHFSLTSANFHFWVN